MATHQLDCRELSNLQNEELRKRLQNAVLRSSEDQVSSFLIEAVECGGVPPSVISVWLPISKEPDSLTAALSSTSRYTRKYAFNKLSRSLQGPEWRMMWDFLGGVQGWLTIFEKSSVEDVKKLINAIRRMERTKEVDEEKRNAVTALVQALFPFYFPMSPFKTKDGRQLSHWYVKLLPACSSDFVMKFLDMIMVESSKISYDVNDSLLLQKHWPAIRLRVTERLKKKSFVNRWVEDWYHPIMNSVPPLPAKSIPGWSAPMEYCFDLLSELRFSLDPAWKPVAVMSNLAGPLLARSLERKASSKLHLKTCQLTISYLQRHPDSGSVKTVSCVGAYSFFEMLLHLWSKEPKMFERVLIDAMEFSRSKRGQVTYFSDCFRYLGEVRGELRYKLLRLWGLHSCSTTVDIDTNSDLKLIPKFGWDAKVFLELERQTAYKLLERVLKSLDEIQWLPYRGKLEILGHPQVDMASDGVFLLLIHLQNGSPKAIAEAEERIQEYKMRANRTREVAERTRLACLVMLYSIASKSLHVLRDTVEYVSRFVKDPTVSSNIFNTTTLHMQEHYEILAGLKQYKAGSDVMELGETIKDANSTLMAYLGIAFKAAKEPSVHAAQAQWGVIRALFNKVLNERILDTQRLQKDTNFSDHDIYAKVWEPTLATFVDAERQCLQPEYDSIDNYRDSGALGFKYSLKTIKQKSLPVLSRFFDNFARERNRIWKDHRIEQDPDVATLPSIWPQGTSVQSLFPLKWDEDKVFQSEMPYLASRARALLFMQKADASAPPLQGRSAELVGRHIDHYVTCLRIYVLLAPESEQRARKKEAWEHAITVLNNFHGVSATYAYWGELFREAFGRLDKVTEELVTLDSRDGGRLTNVSTLRDFDLESINAWDPNVLKPPVSSLQTLVAETRTQVDPCFSTLHHWGTESYIDYKKPREVELNRTQPSFSHFFHFAQESKQVKRTAVLTEAAIAASVMYLDVKKGGSAISMQKEAFPNSSISKRFPPILLDADFTASKEQSVEGAIAALREHLRRTPASLIHNLAREALAVFKGLDESSLGALELTNILFGCLRLLVDSDKPQLARDLIYEATFSLPDLSSWHRQVVQTGVMKRLDPDEVLKFAREFSDHAASVNEARHKALKEAEKKAKETASEGVDIDWPNEETDNIPFLKITTIKLLANLLQSGDIFGFEPALDLLHRMLENFKQIDVRCTVLDSIFRLLEKSPFDTLSEEALTKAMKQLGYLQNIIGGLNERYATNEKMWSAVNLKEPLPEIGTEFPLYERLLNAGNNQKLPERIRDFIVTEIILPAVPASVEANRRWFSLFVEKHGLGVDMSDCPIVTVNMKMLEKTMTLFKERISKKSLKTWQEYQLFLIAPPKNLLEASQKISKDFKLKGSPEGQHWLKVMPVRQTEDQFVHNQFNPSVLSDILQNIENFSMLEIEPADVGDCIIEQVKLVFDLKLKNLNLWDVYYQAFCKNTKSLTYNHHKYEIIWKQRLKPVVQRLLQLVESYRASERHSGLLPDLFSLQLPLVRYAYGGQMGESRSRANEETFQDILALFEELAEKYPVTYYRRLPSLVGALPQHDDDQIIVGIKFAQVDLQKQVEEDAMDIDGHAEYSKMTLATLRRLDLAVQVFRHFHHPSFKHDRELVRKMADSWISNSNEEIKYLGRELRSVPWVTQDLRTAAGT